MGAAWQHVFGLCFARGIAASRSVGLCHDDPEITDPARFRYDACVPVDAQTAARFSPTEAARAITIDGGRFAVTLHTGSYAHLPETYGSLMRWALERDLVPSADPSVERYLDDPRTTAEDALRTEIALRLS